MKRFLLLSIFLVTSLFSEAQSFGDKVISNNAYRLSPSHGDLWMRRFIDKDEKWKRALVPSPKTLIINYNGDFVDGVRLMGPQLKIDNKLTIGKDLNSTRFAMITWWNSKVGHTNSSVVMNGTRSSDGTWHLRGDGARSSIGFITTDIFSNMRFVTHHDDQFKDGKTLTDEQMIKENTKMIIKTNGNVGIGTSNPQASFHVHGAGKTLAIGDKTNQTQPALKFYGGHTSKYAYIQAGGAATPNLRFSKYDTTEGTLENFQVISKNAFFSSNVGIGVSKPEARLHIAAGNHEGILIGKYRDKLGWNGTGEQPGYHIRFAGYRDVSGKYSGARISALRTNLCCEGKAQGMELAFYTTNSAEWDSNGDVNLKEAMRINANGNVGIGTSNAKQKLSVNGIILAREIMVSTDPADWPDYVFEKEYPLRKLSDVENFIKTNKHLPDMPSAAAVAKDGVKLAEMNKRLLQKVEELTLYLIEQDKKLNTQQQLLEKQTSLLQKQQDEIQKLKK